MITQYYHTQIINDESFCQYFLQNIVPQYAQARFFIICDDNVAELYGQAFFAELSKHAYCSIHTFAAGEDNKSLATYQRLIEEIQDVKLTKDDIIIGMGGGLSLDMAGFVAATLLRGLKLIFIPTTLLAMVDACVGGKNGVNTSIGKNQVGTVYEPHSVVIDLAFLQSLTTEKMHEGFCEIIKYGLVADPSLLLHLNQERLGKLIDTCISLKLDIVHKKNGFISRDILNFGHNIGHALEKASNYRLSHAKAVAIGMCMEARLSPSLSREEIARIDEWVTTFFPESFNSTLPDTSLIIEALKHDKKNTRNEMMFVLLERIGQVKTTNKSVLSPVIIPEVVRVIESFSLAPSSETQLV